MKKTTRIRTILLIMTFVAGFGVTNLSAQTDYRKITQGYAMKLKMDNRGVFGRVSYTYNILPGSYPVDSMGLQYPLGSRIEHIYGAGVWIAGRVDTSAVPGTNPRIKVVSTAYEGWRGPYFELFPLPSDEFWSANKNNPVKPPGWDDYWKTDLDFKPISDNDLYARYTDYYQRPTSHVPMGIKVVQSSYAWDDPYAEAIIINEYKISNVDTTRTIEDLYVGFFCDADVGPNNVANFPLRNFTGYYQNSRTAYIHNPSDRGSTPVGISLLYPDPDTTIIKKYTFQWFPGPETPAPDANKYDMMASGNIKPDEFPALSDTRFLFSFGPFTLSGDTVLKIAVGIISGTDLRDLQKNANRAVDIYKNQGIKLPATPPSPPLRAEVGFRRVKLNWKWQPGDLELFGRPDPETNWDTTSQVARWDSARISPPYPPGIDPNRGGRNFEAFKLWRSEHPGFDPVTGKPQVPDASFTLLKQFDVIGTSDSTKFEYESGLQYEFIDSNLVRGKVYVYSVTSKSIPNIAYQTIRIGDRDTIVTVPVEPLESGKLTNAVRVDLPFAVSTEQNKVSVVPNPYRTDQDYRLESGGYEGLTANWTENERKVKFINLPERCTIRIFSLSGDLVRTVEHDGGGGAFPRGDHDVLLVSESNRALASGIYVFTVESNLGVQTGKFVIIR